jgi:hypothetical protein
MATVAPTLPKLVRGTRAILPWLIASLAATLLSHELTPPASDTAVSPPASTQPEKKEEIVYEPWEQVST